MSFSAKVKGEICRYTDISIEEALAEISAIMKGSGTIGFSGKGLSFRITTENPASMLQMHGDVTVIVDKAAAKLINNL